MCHPKTVLHSTHFIGQLAKLSPNKMSDRSSLALTIQPVHLYRCAATSDEWISQNSCGIATVCIESNSVWISLVDSDTKEVKLKQECCTGFDYQMLSDDFHCFESTTATDSDHIGLLFSDRLGASMFGKHVSQLITMMDSRTSPIHEPPTTLHQQTCVQPPSNFERTKHLGFNPKKGFTEIPPEWQKIFAKAGISPEELKDKKTAKFLLKTIASVEKINQQPNAPSQIVYDSNKGFTEIPPEWQKIFEKAGISPEELKDRETAEFLLKTLLLWKEKNEKKLNQTNAGSVQTNASTAGFRHVQSKPHNQPVRQQQNLTQPKQPLIVAKQKVANNYQNMIMPSLYLNPISINKIAEHKTFSTSVNKLPQIIQLYCTKEDDCADKTCCYLHKNRKKCMYGAKCFSLSCTFDHSDMFNPISFSARQQKEMKIRDLAADNI